MSTIGAVIGRGRCGAAQVAPSGRRSRSTATAGGAAVVALCALLANACGNAGTNDSRLGSNPSLAELATNRQQAGLIAGTSDYGAGRIRISFLLTRPDGSLILRPATRVWIAPDRSSRPLATSTAHLESITTARARVNALGSSRLYVAHTTVTRAGKYWLLVEPVGGRPFAALAPLLVKKRTTALPIGARAPVSQTPTIASARGDLRAITTHTPPDRELLGYSVAASLAARRPFVVVFASPAICLSRTCGPIVDIVDQVRRRFPPSGVRFIHVEPFMQNNPALGFNRWAKEWSIPSEPFTFLVGKDGRIKAEFEGSISAAELTAAVRTALLSQ